VPFVDYRRWAQEGPDGIGDLLVAVLAMISP
jgi:hypothetical protein